MVDTDNIDIASVVQNRFKQLPKVVQDAITSADIAKHLRELAESHKLHLDQWQVLENQVMFALLGIDEAEDLAANIEQEVGVSHEESIALAGDISRIVFEPIRQELERQLEHPEAKAAQETQTEAVRREILADKKPAPLGEALTPDAVPTPVSPSNASQPAIATVAAGTPPAPAPVEKAVREPIASTYTSTASHERKEIAGDPYREQVV